MGYSKLSIVLCLTVCIAVLLAPFVIEISPDGIAYAGSSKKGNKGHGVTGGIEAGDKVNAFGYERVEPNAGSNTGLFSVSEPVTMLMVGGGALGLAALIKKIKKK